MPEHWEITKSILHFDGKVLMLKSLRIDDNETAWDFNPCQPMSVEQAWISWPAISPRRTLPLAPSPG